MPLLYPSPCDAEAETMAPTGSAAERAHLRDAAVAGAVTRSAPGSSRLLGEQKEASPTAAPLKEKQSVGVGADWEVLKASGRVDQRRLGAAQDGMVLARGPDISACNDWEVRRLCTSHVEPCFAMDETQRPP